MNLPILLTASMAIGLGSVLSAAEPTYEELKASADTVLRMADNVEAASQAHVVFAAANAAVLKGVTVDARHYFTTGLQLSPWDLGQQLAFASFLSGQGEEASAREAAKMVEERAETDELYHQARDLLKKPKLDVAKEMNAPASGPWVCMVRLGHVEEVVLQESRAKLEAVLGIPVMINPESISLGKSHRSAYLNWYLHEVMPHVKWDSLGGSMLLKKLNVDAPAKARPEAVVTELVKQLKAAGRQNEAEGLLESGSFYRQRDQQWDANQLVGAAPQLLADQPGIERAVVVGVTEVDLFSEGANYLFGTATVGGRRLVSSYARFRSYYHTEPPDRARLVGRMHKLLLSSIGNSLGVPRPTDPTSARSYPKSLPEHDAKSEYMSEACIAGFEKALQIKLPDAAHKPER